MSTGPTTLEEELLRGAERADFAALQCTPQAVGVVGWKYLRGVHEAEAAQLRARAAWARELERDANELRVAEKVDPTSAWQMLRRLAGPIPAAETDPPTCKQPLQVAAPTERKEP